MAKLVGTWQFVSVENLEALLNELKLPDDIRKKAMDDKPKLTISMPDSNHVTIHKEGSPHPITCAFGQEFEHPGPCGKTIKSIMTKESDTRLMSRDTAHTGGIVYELHGHELLVTTHVGDVKSTAKFHRA
ncbi:unnamed protein product [Calicophoron daubneyi]|uniref:Lipocalin/cytosolic fatty-acid binding domain-containing protein n=1 Tax=Calicophoron daubneyi TaxID=300641 RepID=A0AAV2TT14_CALDB